MKEIFIKICRDLPRGFCASKHRLGGVSIYYGSTPNDTCLEIMAVREQTEWDQGKWKRTGKYLISRRSSYGTFKIYKKDLSFSQAADLTKQLLEEL